MTASSLPPVNCQSRLVFADPIKQAPWHNRGNCTLEQAAIAEAAGVLCRDRKTVVVEVRHSDKPEMIYPPLVVVLREEYEVRGLRGGDHD